MLHARNVLADCKKAHALLETEVDAQKFRILWVAGIALARAVGHILENVDSKKDERVAAAIRAKWQDWKENEQANRIFWHFIEEERNQVLKEYAHGFLAGSVHVIVANQSFELDENLFKPLSEGVFAGEDCRDILEDAIEWWEGQLLDIENVDTKL